MNDQTACVIHPSISLDGYAGLSVPVYRASTIRFSDAQSYAKRFERGDDGYVYGLYGTPTVRTLEKQLATLEQAERTFLVPSGQAAVALAMLSVLSPGGTVLIPDSVYPPVRDFANNELQRYGMRTVFYDPAGKFPEHLLDASTRLIWIESPGSTTMEFQDVPEIVRIAQRRDILVGCDNTWATPLLFKPLANGVDISVHALTKYASGHSDVLMGSISVRDGALASAIKGLLGRLGVCASPDECSLVLRGVETLPVRLHHSARVAESIARWIARQPLTERVLHPALSACPGHDAWKRDFAGASGVFSVVLEERAIPHIHDALDALSIFAIGASWGGTRSLMVPMSVKDFRTARPWNGPDLIVRLSVGLEAEEDLMRDLERFFARLTKLCADGADRATLIRPGVG